jgi:hypothetical protein
MPTLHTMFKRGVNVSFNNTLFSPGTIVPMHKTTERLYLAAAELRKIKGQSQIARLLNESPQTVKNWETRGVSLPGALKAQTTLGVSAAWLLEGTGQMTSDGTSVPSGSIFDAMTQDERDFLENFRTLTDHDREKYLSEISAKAEEMRAYLAKHMQKAGLPAPKSAAERASSKASTTVEAAKQRKNKDAEDTEQH